ncbi:MAG TPA: hypothetical protein VFE47_26020 [Tepidisphaeraceae bacterium]|jgi:hypothetical protein|nr:hypothetical protein [Tepidisphaeraceae bacterium]
MASDIANFERESLYLVRARIADRKELRRLRKLPALGMRGPDDLTGSGRELFCAGGLQDRLADGHIIVWELRQWDPARNASPESVGKVPGWRHMVLEGFEVTTMAKLAPIVGWL